MKLSLRRFALPLLLLVLLGAARWGVEWRQEHPSLSPKDQMIREATRDASHLQITGEGPQWQPLTGAFDNQNLYIADGEICRSLVEVLRCTDQWLPVKNTKLDLEITVSFANDKGDQLLKLTYLRNRSGAYLDFAEKYPYTKRSVKVQPRFATRFETLIAGVAHRAQAPGQHPNLEWGPPPTY